MRHKSRILPVVLFLVLSGCAWGPVYEKKEGEDLQAKLAAENAGKPRAGEATPYPDRMQVELILQAICDEILYYNIDKYYRRNLFNKSIYIGSFDESGKCVRVMYELWPWGEIVRPVYFYFSEGLCILLSEPNVLDIDSWPSWTAGGVQHVEGINVYDYLRMKTSWPEYSCKLDAGDRENAIKRQIKRYKILRVPDDELPRPLE